MRPVALRKQSRAFLHNHDVPLAPIATLGLEHLGVETYDHSVVAAVQTRLRLRDAAAARLKDERTARPCRPSQEV